jgi:hypothetical protein
MYITDEPRDAIQHVIEPTLSVAKPIVATPTSNSKSSQEEPRDAMRHDAEKLILRVAYS